MRWLLSLLCVVALAVPAVAATETLPVSITADSLEYHENEGTYVARGAAKVVRGDVTIKAAVMTAYGEKDAAGDVQIVRVEAEGAKGDPSGVVVTSGAQGENRVQGARGIYEVTRGVVMMTGGDLRLTTPQDEVTAAQSLEYWEKEKQAVARGDAVAARSNADGSVNRIAADTLTAELATDKQGELAMQRITADGNVLIATKEDVVRGARGAYDVAGQKASLEGDVKITRGKNQLSGALAEVDLARGVSRLVSAGGGQKVKGLLVPDQAQESAGKQ